MFENICIDTFCNISQNFDNDLKEDYFEETIKEDSELTNEEYTALYIIKGKSDVSKK